jgi:hypothetical protein
LYYGDWTTSGTGTDNTWQWRATTNHAVGGALITNSNGEILFLPVAGYRDGSSGMLGDIGDFGYYWSSAYISNYSAYRLRRSPYSTSKKIHCIFEIIVVTLHRNFRKLLIIAFFMLCFSLENAHLQLVNSIFVA